MIHHVSVGSNDLPRAKAFYQPLMALIGFRLLKETTRPHTTVRRILFSASRRRWTEIRDRRERCPYRLPGTRPRNRPLFSCNCLGSWRDR